MKKWFVCILLILLPCGCAETPHAEHGQEVTLYEAKQEHLFGWVEKQVIPSGLVHSCRLNRIF